MTTPDKCPNSEGPFENTDREIWREAKDDYYSPSIHVTKGGGIGINVGGTVHVMGVRTWHALADEVRELEQQLAAERAKVAKLREALQDAVAGVWDGHYGRGITADYARTVDAKAREALEETR